MTSLSEVFEKADQAKVIEDCVELLDKEVKDKSGLSGLAIKAGYKTVKGFKPGFLREVIGNLLPPFTKALEPIYQEAQEKDRPVADYFTSNQDRVADALLSITDRRVESADKGLIKSTYKRLRPQAKKHVTAAVPRLGSMVARYGS